MAELDVILDMIENIKYSVFYDGKIVGEIVIRGSGIMKGYLKDEKVIL